ncbi:nuclease-related domain-containing protein [Heyndrickxia sp. NPDC080065]|uniref:nuclease-related domain-containing protein n=1 Tax=Heyndrickxia sp. NPDC080065 TaxID=3390568 RepID=UPI003D0829BE
MIFKPRNESVELKLLRYLNERMHLSEKDKMNYLTLEKGFKGEQTFDERIKNISNDWLILNDLLLESNNTICQIDSLLISNPTIYMIEIKNYEGDYYIEADRWYSISGNEIKNPILQLKRSESLFRRLLQDLGLNYPIESYVIFINPEFHLYQAPRNLPIIFPTQLSRFINKFTQRTSKMKDKYLKLAEQLVSVHSEESPYKRIPDYTFDQLKKGVACARCRSFVNDFSKNSLVCETCDHKENVTAAVIRSVEEWAILFPERKITTNEIQEWCKIIPRRTILNILSKNFKIIGFGRTSYYMSYET